MPLRTPINDHRRLAAFLSLLTPALMLAGCSSLPSDTSSTASAPAKPVVVKRATAPALPPAGSGRGGYYQDDGPGERIPEGLLDTPDAEPRIEPYASRGNRPYKVFGKTYVPMLDEQPFKQRGIGSWYGKKFHGQKTSSGELYDMYKMTAAHPTLPIPSYARVTNLANGRQVIVRVNDRGPFHAGRIIDLSYTAALKLGYLGRGSSELEVERLLPDEIARMQSERQMASRAASPPQADTPAVVAASSAASSDRTTEATLPASATASAHAAIAMDDKQALKQPAVLTEPMPKSAATPIAYAVPATPAVVVEPAAAPAAGGFYLQLGAYTQAGNAEAKRSQLQQHWGGTLMPIDVVANNGLYRLYSGPFATRADAAVAAQKLQQGGAIKPMIVQK